MELTGGESLKRFDAILLFCVFAISSSVLFQNCSEISRSARLPAQAADTP